MIDRIGKGRPEPRIEPLTDKTPKRRPDIFRLASGSAKLDCREGIERQLDLSGEADRMTELVVLALLYELALAHAKTRLGCVAVSVPNTTICEASKSLAGGITTGARGHRICGQGRSSFHVAVLGRPPRFVHAEVAADKHVMDRVAGIEGVGTSGLRQTGDHHDPP